MWNRGRTHVFRADSRGAAARLMGRDDDHVLALGEEVEREDPLDRGAMNGLGSVPLEVGHDLVAPELRVAEAALDAVAKAGVELGLHEVLQ